MKIKSLAEVARIARRLRSEGKTVVTTNGCFDLLHVGHVRGLKAARALGDTLIVGVNTDRSVRANKGPLRPIVPERERAEVLAALESVDYVFLFSNRTPIPWVKKIRPNIHAKGADRTVHQIVEREAVEAGGGKIVLLPYLGRKSTTQIIERIRAQD